LSPHRVPRVRAVRCSRPVFVRDRQVSDRHRQFSNICSNDTPVNSSILSEARCTKSHRGSIEPVFDELVWFDREAR
jgi:hypothetical protein